MKSADTLISAAVFVAIVAVVIVSIFVFSGQAFSLQWLIGEKTDSRSEAEVIGEGTLAAFYEEAYTDHEIVVLRIIPTDAVSMDYHLSYSVVKGYGEEYSREENLTFVSPDNPIVIEVSRMADEWVDIFAEVRDQDGLLVWESQSGYG
ncbi:MAG: hypothetical protein JW931_03280 [Methanomicrobiaceae archaeon]|nr:hypothetical protein [Methanomicrobiaceae archaeon]